MWWLWLRHVNEGKAARPPIYFSIGAKFGLKVIQACRSLKLKMTKTPYAKIPLSQPISQTGDRRIPRIYIGLWGVIQNRATTQNLSAKEETWGRWWENIWKPAGYEVNLEHQNGKTCETSESASSTKLTPMLANMKRSLHVFRCASRFTRKR